MHLPSYVRVCMISGWTWNAFKVVSKKFCKVCTAFFILKSCESPTL